MDSCVDSNNVTEKLQEHLITVKHSVSYLSKEILKRLNSGWDKRMQVNDISDYRLDKEWLIARRNKVYL
jgi:hypothetical protein